MKEIMHVSQSEQQPQGPVLHLSDMLADVGSASPRAEEERVFNTLLEQRCCVSVFHPTSTKSTKPAGKGRLRHVIRRVLASGFLLKVDFRRFV